MGDLLNGFKVGMQLGAPFVEAQLRKREFQRQSALQARDQANRSNDAAANRVLSRQLSKDKIAAAESRLDKELAAKATGQDKEIGADASNLKAQIASAEAQLSKKILATAFEGVENRGARALEGVENRGAQALLSAAQIKSVDQRHAKQLAFDSQSKFSRLVDDLELVNIEKNDLTTKLESPGYWSNFPDQARKDRARLTAIMDASTMAATAADVSIKKFGMSAMGEAGELFNANDVGTLSQHPFREPQTNNLGFSANVDLMNRPVSILNRNDGSIRLLNDPEASFGVITPPVAGGSAGGSGAGVSVSEDPLNNVFEGVVRGQAGQLQPPSTGQRR